MKIRGIIFVSFLVIAFNLNAQSAAEKIGNGYCECAKNYDYNKYSELFAKNIEIEIRTQMDSIYSIIQKTKRCVKETVILTKEERRRVPEDEITRTIEANCPNVIAVKLAYQKMEQKIENELREKDIKERNEKIEYFIANKEFDSATTTINQYISYYGNFSTNFIQIINYYYQMNDLTSANMNVSFFVDQLTNDGFIHDERKDKSIPMKTYIKSELIKLTTKYNQSEMTKLVNTIQ